LPDLEKWKLHQYYNTILEHKVKKERKLKFDIAMTFLDVKTGLRGTKHFSKIQTAEIKSAGRDKGCDVIAKINNYDI
jgi:hypothetical protein